MSLVERVSGAIPCEIRLNTLQPNAKTSNKFFIRMDSLASAGLVRLELNGRYLRDYRASIKVSFFASNLLKAHLKSFSQAPVVTSDF